MDVTTTGRHSSSEPNESNKPKKAEPDLEEKLLYPEHLKLHAENHKTEIIHQFLEWCQSERGIALYKHGEKNDTPMYVSNTDDLMWDFIGVDKNTIESEKRAMLERCRGERTLEENSAKNSSNK